MTLLLVQGVLLQDVAAEERFAKVQITRADLEAQ